MFNEGDEVILSENIFPNSSDPDDVKMRGKHGVISLRMWEHMRGSGWEKCYEIIFFDGGYCYVQEDEIRKDE